MKRTKIYFYFIVTISALVLVSCKKESQENFGKPTEVAADLGKEIFEGKGTCATCHKTDIKLVGPSMQDIAKIYKEKNASIATFLKGDEKPIVDPTQFEVMKANFALTKTFTDEERQSLEEYVLSQGK
jgi:cytochrome c